MDMDKQVHNSSKGTDIGIVDNIDIDNQIRSKLKKRNFSKLTFFLFKKNDFFKLHP
jgi:hypothetical protein